MPDPRPPLRHVQRSFWRLIRQGSSSEDAAEAVGASRRTGQRWFREAGGMPPLSLQEPVDRASRPGRGPLSIEEREVIAHGLAQRRSHRAIAAELGRHHGTVSREVARNRGQRRDRDPGGVWVYSPIRAQRRAESRARRPKPAKLATHLTLRELVQQRLRENHSPEQIAARLAEEFPDDPEMQVSHETIYQALYVQSRGALKRELTQHLRTGRSLRKPQRRADRPRARVLDMVLISERPPEVEDRAVPGHWEGDLILGANNASAIGTLVERSTRFVMLLHLPSNHHALTVQQAIVAKMATLPDQLRRTLTWDQGIEMANHLQIAAEADLEIYFCDPHSPWQRGTNENTNGLLRQYFPKGTDLSFWGPGYLDHVAAELNDRPRKTLNWRTPAEALQALLSDQPQPPGVALTG
jgi:IS30 family transposase